MLTDDPADVDAFGPDGPHTVVARAILDLVQGPSRGLCIGLYGDRGSGKSTVVKQIARLAAPKSATDAPDLRIFTFDAWAHEGDPLRRAFLEELIEFLKKGESPWLPTAFADNQSAQLKGRNTKTDRTTTSSLTSSGIWLAASGLLVPVGLGLMAGGFSAPAAAWPGLALTVAPALAAATMVWWNWSKKKPKETRAEYIRSLFAQSSKSDEHSDTATTPEPTSVEFREIFCNALTKALNVNDRRLLIVLDNLYRLDPPD
ncbi:MAG: P-loop NTPase fold protein, partial [Terriglobales bacterium]